MKKHHILPALLIAFYFWTGCSFLDVILHNLSPEPVYAAWNLFAMFF